MYGIYAKCIEDNDSYLWDLGSSKNKWNHQSYIWLKEKTQKRPMKLKDLIWLMECKTGFSSTKGGGKSQNSQKYKQSCIQVDPLRMQIHKSLLYQKPAVHVSLVAATVVAGECMQEGDQRALPNMQHYSV